jgi:hypothetical protein
MNIEDDEPTPEERAEAEALARALETGRAAGPVPGDALETAALLRHAKDQGALDEARAESILSDVLERARPPARTKSGWRWPLFGALGLGAAAAAVALVVRSGAPEVAAFPRPPRALLEAQMEAARSRASGLGTVASEMKPYRREVFAALEERYRR